MNGERIEGPSVRETSSGPRWLLHLVLSTGAWAVFGWFWYLVFYQRTGEQTLRGLQFLVVFLLVAVLTTLLWIRHNLAIHRRKGPRKSVPTVTESWDTDRFGRTLEADWSDARGASLVVVDFDDKAKRFRVEPDT